jgi:hypothetical protein
MSTAIALQTAAAREALPSFPDFKELELTDRDTVTAYTSGFDNYSDFNFTSLWSWDSDGRCGLSDLHGNLVIRMVEYESDRVFLTFIGTIEFAMTVRELLSYSILHLGQSALRLVPEPVALATAMAVEGVVVEEDPDNHDYVLSTREWESLEGGRFRRVRNQLHQFAGRWGDPVIELDLTNVSAQDDILRAFDAWLGQKGDDPRLHAAERIALQRSFQAAAVSNIVGLGIYIDGTLEGFDISDHDRADCATGHFLKANRDFPGIYRYLHWAAAHRAGERGIPLFNVEQDLGVPGLQQMKRSLNPCQLLRKYTIRNVSRVSGLG